MNKKLVKIFKKLNNLHWKGRLPMPDLILSGSIEGLCGLYIYETDYGKKDYIIKISKDLTSKQIESTMLHEMCHHVVYIRYPRRHFRRDIPKDKKIYPHGKEWIKEMRRVGFKGKINSLT